MPCGRLTMEFLDKSNSWTVSMPPIDSGKMVRRLQEKSNRFRLRMEAIMSSGRNRNQLLEPSTYISSDKFDMPGCITSISFHANLRDFKLVHPPMLRGRSISLFTLTSSVCKWTSFPKLSGRFTSWFLKQINDSSVVQLQNCSGKIMIAFSATLSFCSLTKRSIFSGIIDSELW